MRSLSAERILELSRSKAEEVGMPKSLLAEPPRPDVLWCCLVTANVLRPNYLLEDGPARWFLVPTRALPDSIPTLLLNLIIRITRTRMREQCCLPRYRFSGRLA